MTKQVFTIVADPRVDEDLREAKSYLELKRKNLGSKFLKDYRLALQKLQINPFYQIRYKEIRCLPLEKFRYMIHYHLDEKLKLVTVYAVVSTYLNPENHWM